MQGRLSVKQTVIACTCVFVRMHAHAHTIRRPAALTEGLTFDLPSLAPSVSSCVGTRISVGKETCIAYGMFIMIYQLL